MVGIRDSLGKYTTGQIVEAMDECLNDSGVRENILLTIEEWDKEGQEELLNYLDKNFGEGS